MAVLVINDDCFGVLTLPDLCQPHCRLLCALQYNREGPSWAALHPMTPLQDIDHDLEWGEWPGVVGYTAVKADTLQR